MFYELANSRLGFWVVAVLIIIGDGALLLRPGEYLFSFKSDGKPSIRVPATPFIMRNRELILSSVLYFAVPFFLCTLDMNVEKTKKLRHLHRMHRCCRSIAVFPVSTFVVTTIIGPSVALIYGNPIALTALLPVLYLNAIFALIFVYSKRHAFKIPPRYFVRLCFEFILCPALVTNLNKRITIRPILFVNASPLIHLDTTLQSRVQNNLDLFDTVTDPRK